MARVRGPKHKVSRRFGFDVYGTGGASLQRRLNTPPGGMRRRNTKRSEYARQLFEKQKVKAVYGVLERQFRRYFDEASRQHGPSGENLLGLLERRLDNVVYRLGIARSRPMARQIVGHGHVQVNGHKVDIPSYLVRPGETITLTETAAQMPTVIEELESRRPVPAWLQLDGTTGRVIRLPRREDIELPVELDLIVAFYARR